MRGQKQSKLLGSLLLAMVFTGTSLWLPILAGGEALPGAQEGQKPTAGQNENQSAVVSPPAEEAAEEAKVAIAVESEPTTAIIRELPPLKGPKKSIAVTDLENKADFSGEWNLGEAMADGLSAALAQTNRFIVVERAEVKRVVEQQDLAALGRAARAAAARRGKVIPAQVRLTGAVTNFSFEKQMTGTGSGEQDAAVGDVTGTAHVGIDLKILDIATDKLVFTDRVEKKAAYTGVEADYSKESFAIGTEHFQKSPLGKATQEAIEEAVYRVATSMEKIPWRGSIVLTRAGTVIINSGQREGIVSGQKFVVYNVGEELTDPETGEILGVEETRAGTISVAEVYDRYSIAMTEEGEGFKRGDWVRVD